MSKDEKVKLHISVRNLVEFIFREGDIDNRSGKLQNTEAMSAGTRIHKKIQKSMGEEYQSEVPLIYDIEDDLYILTVEGRADGIFTEYDEERERELVYIDEIKGMYKKVLLMDEPIFVHKAQAMCYAYIFAFFNSLSEVGVQMTYCNLETEEIKCFREIFTFEKLQSWFDGLMEDYAKWARFQCEWKQIRQESIKQLDFPYDYRQGQKKLVEDVYRTILRRKNLFMQAPTGVGKTISTIFPAVKAVGENLGDRIFYLTAKTITASVAIDTFSLLSDVGYRAKIIQITAKEKMCMCDEMDCNPVNCPYAKGHYDRVNDAVYSILTNENFFTREAILKQAEEYMVCPFELSLDISSWCDDIVCDYNYAFDPNVYLKRFFQEGIKGDYIFLIDEAHNLVERSREMYSAAIYKEDFLSIKKIIKPYSKKIEKILDKCNRSLLEYKRECDTYVIYENIGSLIFSLMRLASELDDFLQKPMEFAGRSDVTDFYFSVRNFLAIYDLVDEHYEIYSEILDDGRFMLKLFCVDPSLNLQNCIDKAQSAIFFSATLLPINYYKSLLSTRSDNYAIYAHSVFDEKQRLLLFGNDVSTKYTRRNSEEFRRMAEYIHKTVRCKTGNYMVFFPSYKLMNQVYEIYRTIDLDAEHIIQTAGMKEKEREEFLNAFSEKRDKSLVAFCVMGGIFGEGIDLKNEQLIGVLVVGTGLPQISNEREILKNYYDDINGYGFDYAFRYPGINKVLQAAGRVIRTVDDKGVIILLDERFLQSDYEPLYPREWNNRVVCGIEQLEDNVKDFWKNVSIQ